MLIPSISIVAIAHCTLLDWLFGALGLIDMRVAQSDFVTMKPLEAGREMRQFSVEYYYCGSYINEHY